MITTFVLVDIFMKPVERPYFYDKYLHLIEGEDPKGHFESISMELTEVIDDTKDIGFTQHYYTLVLVVLLPLFLLTLTFYIKEGWSYKLLPGIVSILFVLYKRSQLVEIVKETSKPVEEAVIKDYLIKKFSYVKQGLHTKGFKVSFLQQLFIGFFPWIMFLLSDLIIGPFSSFETLSFLIIAYVLSCVLWYRVFNEELARINPLAESVNEMETIFYRHN